MTQVVVTGTGRGVAVLHDVAAVGSAVNGGVLLAFSLLVVPGLDRLAQGDPRGAVTGMQGVNEAALRAPFMILFFGTALVALAAGVLGVVRRTPSGWVALGAAAVFLVGVVLVTIGRNVPLNDALAAVGPGDDTVRAWAAFSPGWVAANHVRAVCGVVASALFVVANRVPAA